MLRAAARALASWAVIIVLLIAWEAVARRGLVTPFMLPPLSDVVARIVHDATEGNLAENVALTLYRALTGFAIAAVGGIALGLAMSRNGGVRWFFDPLISVGFPMPKIAFLPIIVLWLGFYDVSKISMVVFEATFPVGQTAFGMAAGAEKAQDQVPVTVVVNAPRRSGANP